MSLTVTNKSEIDDFEESVRKSKIILLDIEGTITSISYVKDTLFSFIRRNLDCYLKAHWKDSDLDNDLLLLREQANEDKRNGIPGVVIIPEYNESNEKDLLEAAKKNVIWQMDLDRKTKALKQFQGHVMHEGYKQGKLKGHIYPDVLPALKSWVKNGKKVYIYSSGSIEAQKLLFGHSEEGDILEYFSGHFDTEVGPKVESNSYFNIMKRLNCESDKIVFFTDVPKEAEAANGAGIKTILVVREGNSPLTEEDKKSFSTIRTFKL
ncbi:Enolase-phosphatase E1 [Blattella germanica]|nr:Enolase-phosphatase E1 [Blattella germanica]